MLVDESPRAQSLVDVRPAFLVRTSQILKKVSHFRGPRGRSDSRDLAIRSTRSMDFARKTYMDVGTHHSAELAMTSSSTHSSNSHSPAGSATAPGGQTEFDGNGIGTIHRRTVSGGALPPQIPDGLPRSEPLAWMFRKAQGSPEDAVSPAGSSSDEGLRTVRTKFPSPIEEQPSSHFREPAHTSEISQASEATVGEATLRRLPTPPISGYDPLPSPWETMAAPAAHMHLAQASEGLPLSFEKRDSQDHTTRTLPSRKMSLSEATALIAGGASLSERRELSPRLGSLPPPMMAHYSASGTARFTPSMVARPPPMPIFNLPTLPAPSSTAPRAGPSRAPLRSMPALPMQGPSEAEREADHESAELTDDEDDDEADSEHEPDPDMSMMAREADGGASDEEDGEEASDIAPDGPRSGPSTLSPKPANAPFLIAEAAGPRRSVVYHSPHADALHTPLVRPAEGSSSADYFSARDSGQQSPTRTPRPSDFFSGGASRTPVLGNGSLLLPMHQGSPRPGLYHHGSKSMVDLLSISRKGKEVAGSPVLGGGGILDKHRSTFMQAGPPTIPEDEPRSPHAAMDRPEEPAVGTPTLRRQRSLPTYKASSEPPPYPSFHPRAGQIVQPRDEEGRECLPVYTNGIHLAAIMPRKLEFSQPGVQARDRKWRRVLCVLEGTAFKVYKCPSRVVGVSAIEQWWERKVGVGDITNPTGSTITASGIRVTAVRERPRDTDRASKTADPGSPMSPVSVSSPDGSEMPASGSQPPPAPPPTRSKLHGLLHPARSGFITRSRMSIDSQRDDARLPSPPIVTRQSSDAASSRSAASSSLMSHSMSGSSATVTTPAVTPSASSDTTSFVTRSRMHSSAASSVLSTSSSRQIDKGLLHPNSKDLLRSYTLQNAESGLASDYIKRKNVIRVRMEGEQFLLQSQDVTAVIEWIENIQAATNIALDLDERPMPKGPMFPRRRRRRARAANDPTTRSLRIDTQLAR